MQTLKQLMDAVRPLAKPGSRAGRYHEDVAALLDYLAAMGTPFDMLMGQIAAMKKRSDAYKDESERDGNLDQADKHARVSGVLKELERLGNAFAAQAAQNNQSPTS